MTASKYNSSTHHNKFHRGPSSDDVDSMTGRAALRHLDLHRGEVFYIKVMVDDALVAPGREAEVQLEVIGDDGYSVTPPLSISIDKKHLIPESRVLPS